MGKIVLHAMFPGRMPSRPTSRIRVGTGEMKKVEKHQRRWAMSYSLGRKYDVCIMFRGPRKTSIQFR
jgi:hypothetical protein